MRRLALLLASLLAAIAFSWPLPSRLDTVLRDPYDAQTQAWVVAWVSHALTSDPSSLYQANAFAPARDVLAFSEPLLGYGLLAVPLGAAGLSPAGVLNALCILVLGLSVFSIACLALELGASPGAAFVGATTAGFGALTTVQFGFVSFTAFGGIAWMVLFARRLLRGGTLRDAAGLALATATTAYFSLHFLAFGLGTLLVLGVAHLVVAPGPTLRHAGPRMAAAFALAGLILLPVAYLSFASGPTRASSGTAARCRGSPLRRSTSLDDLVQPGAGLLPGRSDSEMALYPGTLALALAIAGLVLVRHAPALPALAGTGALVAAAGALGAMGLNAPLWPALTFLAPPLFGGIRSPHVRLRPPDRDGAPRRLGRRKAPRARQGRAARLLATGRSSSSSPSTRGNLSILLPSRERAFPRRTPSSPVLHRGPDPPPAPDPLAGGSAAPLRLDPRFPRIVNGTLSYVPAGHLALAARFAAGPLTRLSSPSSSRGPSESSSFTTTGCRPRTGPGSCSSSTKPGPPGGSRGRSGSVTGTVRTGCSAS